IDNGFAWQNFLQADSHPQACDRTQGKYETFVPGGAITWADDRRDHLVRRLLPHAVLECAFLRIWQNFQHHF
ncbi:hypothetical protein O5833_29695, partial [Escherichia coli]|nr:hypothetical protein [Escherichia coli]